MAEQNRQQASQFYGNPSRTEVVPFLPPDTRSVLDVGCGPGGFGAALKQRGMTRVDGLEFNSAPASEARKTLDEVFEIDLEQNSNWAPPRKYEVITILDVLEHLQDPWALLKRLQSWLMPHGVVVASVPNLRYWPVLKDLVFAKNFTYTDRGVMDRTHLRFFTQSSMRDMFNRAGYSIVRMEGINATEPYWKARIMFSMMPRLMDDTRYLQFVVVARPN